MKPTTTTFDRRDVLRFATAGLTFTWLGRALRAIPASSPFLAASSPATASKKMLVIFLRGGNDGVNTLIPRHDADYDTALRPTLFVPPDPALDLGTGGAAFHPSLLKLKELHDAGELASIHRVGYADATLSHFSGQRFIETAKPGDNACEEGYIARWVDAAAPNAPFPAVSVSAKLQRSFTGAHALPHVPDIATFQLGDDAASAKLLGTAPTSHSSGTGLLGAYHRAAGPGAFDPATRATGIVMAESMAALASLPPYAPPPSAFPTTDAALAAEGLPVEAWAKEFFQRLEDAVRLLKHSPCRIAGIELHGFDHHANQGTLTGQHPDHLHVLAHGLRSVRNETSSDLWSDLAVLVESEFGRTSRENGSGGTDHGKGSVTFVAGGSVTGGVYNCDTATWPSGASMFSDSAKYVAFRTDYRAILAEIFEKHMGADGATLDLVIPGWSNSTGPEFAQLGFLG